MVGQHTIRLNNPYTKRRMIDHLLNGSPKADIGVIAAKAHFVCIADTTAIGNYLVTIDIQKFS